MQLNTAIPLSTEEFLAYGVLYAIGQDVGVGGDNLLERFVASVTSQENRLV